MKAIKVSFGFRSAALMLVLASMASPAQSYECIRITREVSIYPRLCKTSAMPRSAELQAAYDRSPKCAPKRTLHVGEMFVAQNCNGPFVPGYCSFPKSADVVDFKAVAIIPCPPFCGAGVKGPCLRRM